MTKKKIRILVTGISSGVGQSIYKSLLLSKLNLNIFVGDINYLNIGICQTQKYIKLPKVEEKGSLRKIISILNKNKIDILFVGSELEIYFFSKYKKKIYLETKTLVSISNYEIIKKYSDKYEMTKILKKNRINYPQTFEFTKKNLKKNKIKFPLMLKNKIGTSSRQVYFIKDKKRLDVFSKILDKPIIQEYLSNSRTDFEEFTCSFFKTKESSVIGPFLGRRNLKFGTSWIFETIDNVSLNKVILQISKIDNFEGSINIQLRYYKNKFIPFEINPRYSGTTILRSIQGFNEPEMYIKNFYLNQKLSKPRIKKKGIFFRFIDESYISSKNILKIKKKT